MATISFYKEARLYTGASTNGRQQYIFNASASATWRVLLVNGYVFSAEHSLKSQITNEVTAANYQTNGLDLGNVTWTVATSGTATFDAADTQVTASSTTITANGAVIYYVCAKSTLAETSPFAYVDFSGTAAAGDTTLMKITWNAAGIMELK